METFLAIVGNNSLFFPACQLALNFHSFFVQSASFNFLFLDELTTWVHHHAALFFAGGVVSKVEIVSDLMQ
jgi:hypothetical protein